MSVEKEIEKFTELVWEKYNKYTDLRGSMLEERVTENFKDFYLQLKYICEYLSRDFIVSQEPNEQRGMLVFRRGQILKKTMFDAWREINDLSTNPEFHWQNYQIDFSTPEYIDIILSEICSLFEYYYSLLKDKKVFNCVEIAKGMGLGSITSKIDKANNLKQCYDKLSQITSKQYGINTNSIFPEMFYPVRCAIFHMDYYYEKLPEKNFIIYLNERKSNKIRFDDLIDLTLNILSKLYVIRVVPHYFTVNKSHPLISSKI